MSARLQVVYLPKEENYLLILDQLDRDEEKIVATALVNSHQHISETAKGCAGLLIFPFSVEVAS